MLNVYFHAPTPADERIGEQLIKLTQEIGKNPNTGVVTGGLAPRMLDFSKLMATPDDGRGIVIVLLLTGVSSETPRRDTALRARARFPDAYIVYASASIDDLMILTNKNVKLSGFFHRSVTRAQFSEVILGVCAEHSGRPRAKAPKRSYTVVVGKSMQVIAYDDILYFECVSKKVRIVTKGMAVEKDLEFYESLTNIENEVKANGRFLRCHSGFLVNADHVRAINSKEMRLVLEDGSNIPFSQAKRGRVYQLIPDKSPQL
jgi:hypothetical protein